MAHAMKRAAAITLAAGIALPGAIGTSVVLSTSPAFAQQLSDIGATQGSITVHKFKNPEEIAATTNGQEATPEQLAQAGEAMDGAVFTAQKINLNLADAADFAEAAALKPNEVTEEQLAGNPVLTQTTAGGVATFGELDPGAYLVREVPTEAQLTAGLVPAAPFIVYVPMNDSTAADGWNRDVHVYPKNTELKTTKTVVDADKHPGAVGEDADVLTYTITVPVPLLPENRELTEFSVVDYFNGAELSDVNVTSVQAGGADAAYEVVGGGPQATVSGDNAPADANQKIVVNFTDMSQLSQGGEVTVTVTGKVAQIGSADGTFNDGEVINNAQTKGTTKVTGQGDFDSTEFTTPNSEVKSYFGAVRVFKKDEAGEALPGAEFKVVKGADASCTGAADAPAIHTGTTDADGYAVFNGLHVTDLQNNNVTITDTYCLVETKAPEGGYQLNPTPQPFPLTVQEVTGADRTEFKGVSIAKTLDFENTKIPALTLPGTGGMGVLAIIALGLVIIGGGAYAARRDSAAA